MKITGNQIRAARALAGIEQTFLATSAKLSINTVRNMEAAGENVVRVRLDTLIRVRDALLAKGVIFLDHGDAATGLGVALRSVRQEGTRPEDLTSANDD
jgi:transcriptional regulator with XRE-family HTH domain